MIFKEWIKKDEVMDIIKGLPQDLWEEYIYMLKGVWCDEDMHIEALQAEPRCYFGVGAGDIKPLGDMVEVVRCKDCKYYEAPTIHNTKQCAWWTSDPYEQATTEPDDFCSYGKRREP